MDAGLALPLLVALIAFVLAGVTSTVAWNRSRDERRRREARIAALAAAIHDKPLDGPTPAGSAGDLFATGDLSTTGDLFTTRQHAGVGSRFATVAAVGLVVCGGVAALAVVSSSASGEATVRRESGATAASEPSKTSAIEPLELVALGHDRDGDRLTVRGVVRNPASGTALDRVTAVVLVDPRHRHGDDPDRGARRHVPQEPIGARRQHEQRRRRRARKHDERFALSLERPLDRSGGHELGTRPHAHENG
jgi:hypothetical protein